MVSLNKQFDFHNAWRVWSRDRNKTPSPNAGHPMSAAAGALDLVLAKSSVYVLGEDGRQATHQDIERSVKTHGTRSRLAGRIIINMRCFNYCGLTKCPIKN